MPGGLIRVIMTVCITVARSGPPPAQSGTRGKARFAWADAVLPPETQPRSAGLVGASRGVVVEERAIPTVPQQSAPKAHEFLSRLRSSASRGLPDASRAAGAPFHPGSPRGVPARAGYHA